MENTEVKVSYPEKYHSSLGNDGPQTSAQDPPLGREPGEVGLCPGGLPGPKRRSFLHTHHSFQTLPWLHSLHLSVNKDLLNSSISLCV